MSIIEIFNLVIAILFYVCYVYQLAYIPIAWFMKERPHKQSKRNRIAVLIAARNEKIVIGKLIESIRSQDYPAELIDIYVCADNCTDDTAEIARSLGAEVFERNDLNNIGKGYALNFMLKNLMSDKFPAYDSFLVLDADNILRPNYITEINRTFSDGYEIVTSYRNSKNYGDNWISAGYGLWFMRESKYLNEPRMKLGTSCAVSGTGFMFSRKVIEKYGEWNFFTLTEDIEFTVCNVIDGEKVGFASKAELFDEQPTTFAQSYRQRLRWSRGYYQVFGRHGGRLIKGLLNGSFACYDMAMIIMPAAILSALCVVINLAYALMGFILHPDWLAFGASIVSTLLSMMSAIFFVGVITTITEWKHIHCSTIKKIMYMFTFPIFMSTYLPIAIVAIFKNPSWQPIHHNKCMGLDDIQGDAESKESRHASEQNNAIRVIDPDAQSERIDPDMNGQEDSDPGMDISA